MEAKETAATCEGKEKTLKSRLEKVQQEYDSHRRGCTLQISKLEVLSYFVILVDDH